MKTIYKLLIFLCLPLGWMACNDDFMEKYPVDKINDANYWRTPEDLKLYANQFYADIFWKSGFGGFFEDNQSDDYAPASRDSYVWEEFAVPISYDKWNKDAWYNSRSCNYFLTHYGRVTGDKKEIEKYLGEVLFFKSMHYFEKLTLFGDIPWYSEDMNTNSPELYNKRDSRKLVVDSICENLDRAALFLPENVESGRLSKYVALALKSRICLFEGTYRKYHGLGDEVEILEQAAKAAKDIIDSGKFELYSTGGEEDYHNFFLINNKKEVKEAIFYSEYAENILTHNIMYQMREAGTGFSKDFVETYLCIDGKPIALSEKYKGDEKFDDEFVNRDPRMYQSIYTSDKPLRIDVSGNITYEQTPIFSSELTSTGYRIYKLYSPKYEDSGFDKVTIDSWSFRYAEILLNYAEAMAELGKCDEEVLKKSINLIRARAGMPHMEVNIPFVDPNWPKWEISVSPLINEIRRERRIELAAEGFRFNDLKRWKGGKLLENPKTCLGARDPATGEYKEIYPGMTRKWNDRLYLYPLPLEELTLNENMEQNPGWKK